MNADLHDIGGASGGWLDGIGGTTGGWDATADERAFALKTTSNM